MENAPRDPVASEGSSGRPADRAQRDVGFSAEHLLRRSLGTTARQEPTPSGSKRRSRVVRDLVILVAAVLVGLGVAPFADVANPAYPEARAAADRLDAAWKSIVQDGVPTYVAAEAAGLRAHEFVADGRRRTVLTTTEPTSDGVCYAIRYGPGIRTTAGILNAPTSDCTPTPPGVFAEGNSWWDVLPSERITQTWFIPVLVLLCMAALYAATDIPITLLARRRAPAPDRR